MATHFVAKIDDEVVDEEVASFDAGSNSLTARDYLVKLIVFIITSKHRIIVKCQAFIKLRK